MGLWLIASPFTLGYPGAAMAWSDCASGVLILVLGALSLAESRHWARWATASVGVWLLFAPLAFWTPSAAAYANDTLVGSLVVAFAVLIPYSVSLPGPDRPPGWDYNPSAWLQRLPIVGLALVGFFIARYLAAFQLKHIDDAWDPFFGDGTRRILESDVSRAFPVSDAGLGAFSYVTDALAGLLGGTRRWRSMPWVVVLFGVLIIPPGVTSIVLVILQPVAVGAWCTLCLLASVAMLLMVAPTVDEVIATSQFLIESRRRGKGFWRTFWYGGPPESTADVGRSEHHGSLLSQVISGMALSTVPWNLVVSAGLGVWLMAAPSVLGVRGHAADSDHLVGALVVTFALIAIGEPARLVRAVNLLLGAWLIAAPWLMEGATRESGWNDRVVGMLLILLCFRRGNVKSRYGSWDRWVL